MPTVQRLDVHNRAKGSGGVGLQRNLVRQPAHFFGKLRERGLTGGQQRFGNRFRNDIQETEIRPYVPLSADGADQLRTVNKLLTKWRSDVESAIDLISSVVNGLYKERFGRWGLSNLQLSIADLEEIFARDLPRLKK